MQIINQKPVVLKPDYHENITAPFDVNALFDETIVDPLFTPVLAGQPVSIMPDNKTTATKDEIRQYFIRCCGDGVDAAAEQVVKDLLGQCLVTYNKSTTIGAAEMFVIQSGAAAGLMEPSATCIYTPATDVIPTARQFIAGTATYDQFFASLAWYARPETLGFYFVNEIAFDQFTAWFTAQTNQMNAVLPQDTNKMIADFTKLKLTGLTESLVLRNTDGENLDPKCFARLLINQLMLYANVAGPAEFGILPFNLPELICPKTIVFVNVERHSRASARQVADEWKLINSCLQKANRPKMVSNKQLSKLTAQARNLQKIAAAAVTAANNSGQQAGRAQTFKFKKTRPTKVDMARLIKKLIDKMAFVNTSMNTFKSVKPSFAKPNRRDPDDYNKQGKMVSTKYKPDIHLYIDTSGSISERDYQDTVQACIALAKQMNINVYFNSFSHIMSQTTRLHLQGKSNKAIYAEFQKVPKVTGGTDYEQIWHFINKSKKRNRELSILITDFEYTARTAYVRHPKNLYYVPCSTMNWDTIKREAEQFCKSMVHNDPRIRDHILF